MKVTFFRMGCGWAVVGGCLAAAVAAAEPQPPDAARLAMAPSFEARCLQILRAGLRSDEFWPSMHAAEALTLAGRGNEVRGLLASRLETETDDQRRCGLARELVRAGDCAKVSVILGILAKHDSNGHVHAAESLYKVGRVGDGRLLRQAMAQEANPTLQLMAAAALGRCGHPGAMKLLRRQLASDNPEVSRIAGWVLGAIGDESDAPQLRKNVEGAREPMPRCFGEHALALLGDAVGREALARNLADDDPAVRSYAAAFAGDARLISSADALQKLLDDATLDVRVRAAQSLLTLSRPALPDRQEDISVDVYPATKEHPRNSEGAVIELADGSLLYAVSRFIGGRDDASNAEIVARRSLDGGRTWGPVRVLQANVGQENVMSATLRRLPLSKGAPPAIGLFYLVKNGPDDLKVCLRISRDEAETFGQAIPVTSRPGYHVMNNDRVTILASGRILAPIASSGDWRKVNHFTSSCCLSDDGGLSWRHGAGSVDLAKRGAMEPEVLELNDGRVLMIVRTQLGYIAASYSEDGGGAWTAPASWGVKAPEAPATLRRVPATGDLLLVWNHTYESAAGHGGPRTPLNAAVSPDEGRNWTHFRTLETRDDQTYSYTSLTFVADRAVLSYYVTGPDGRLSSRFRSLPVRWFYEPEGRANEG